MCFRGNSDGGVILRKGVETGEIDGDGNKSIPSFASCKLGAKEISFSVKLFFSPHSNALHFNFTFDKY